MSRARYRRPVFQLVLLLLAGSWTSPALGQSPAAGNSLGVGNSLGRVTVPPISAASPTSRLGWTQPQSFGLDTWRQRRTANFFRRTSPFFGDPAYDPLRTSPRSANLSPYYRRYRTSPFRGDPYYDPYAVRRRAATLPRNLRNRGWRP